MRTRLLRAIGWWLAGAALAGAFSRNLLLWLSAPLVPLGAELHFFTPAEGLMATFRLALVVGSLVASPAVIWELGAFVAPALKPSEREGLARFGFWALLMPMLGALFGWFVLVPVASRFLFTFGAERAGEAVWGLSSWLGFVGATMGAAALAFELPVVASILARIGVLTPAFFRERGPHMVVFTFVLAALLTPPDVISQVLLAGPILLLIFASAKLVERIHAGRRTA